MSIKSMNEGLCKLAHVEAEKNPLLEAFEGKTVDADKVALANAMFDAIKALKEKRVTDIKRYETAMQEAIEKLYPNANGWFNVTDVNIFWDLMDKKDPEKVAVDVLADIFGKEEPNEEAEEAEESEDVVVLDDEFLGEGMKYIGNAKIISREELPKVGDKNERGDETVTLVKRVEDEDGHEIYHVYYTEDDALDLIEPNEEPDVDTAIWSFAIPIEESKKPVNETAQGARELDGMINNTEWAYNRLMDIVKDRVAKGKKKEDIIWAVSKAIYGMKDDFGRLPTTREERKQIARDFVETALPKDYIVEEKKPLKEEVTFDERREALAKYLGVAPESLKKAPYSDVVFETEDGEEYIVATDEEGEKLAREEVEMFFEELGIEGFTAEFQEWILENAVDKEWFEEAQEEDADAYIDDIRNEDDDEFETRLAREMHDAGVEDEEAFREYLINGWGDALQWFADNFGEDALEDAVKKNDLIDIEMVADRAVELDGVAHFLASYDFEEIDLGDYLFAYRTN